MNLRDLLDDILRALGYELEDLENYTSIQGEISGVLKVKDPALVFCLPLYDTSYGGNIISEVNNTVVLSFDNIVLNNITSKAGIFISSSEGVINIEARILGYYTVLDNGKTFLAGSWELYNTIINDVVV